MIVRYVGNGQGEVDVRSGVRGWLRRGDEYVVLAMRASLRGTKTLTLMLHDPDPRRGAFDWGWYPIGDFEVVSDALPTAWAYEPYESGFYFQPAAWRSPTFWVDLDRDEYDERLLDAWDAYRTGRDKILREAGRGPGYQGLPGPSCPVPPELIR